MLRLFFVHVHYRASVRSSSFEMLIRSGSRHATLRLIVSSKAGSARSLGDCYNNFIPHRQRPHHRIQSLDLRNTTRAEIGAMNYL